MQFILYLYKRPSRIFQEAEDILNSDGPEAVDEYIRKLPDADKKLLAEEIAEVASNLPLVATAIEKITFSPS